MPSNASDRHCAPRASAHGVITPLIAYAHTSKIFTKTGFSALHSNAQLTDASSSSTVIDRLFL